MFRKTYGDSLPARANAGDSSKGLFVTLSFKRLATSSQTAFSLRLSGFFAAQFFVYGVQLPFLSVWLYWRGLDPAEIGIVTAVPLFLRLAIGPAAAFLADRSGDRRQAVLTAALCALLAVLGLSLAHSFFPILIATTVFIIAVVTCAPIGEAIALAGVRQVGADYGRMRLWGSLSFIVATFAGGAFVGTFGPGPVVWLLVAGTAALALSAWVIPRLEEAEPREKPSAAGQLTLAEVSRVAGSRTFCLFVFSAAVVQASHAVFYVFGSLHWQAQGFSGTTIGILWSVGVLAEVLLFAVSGRFINKIEPVSLIVAGAVAAIIRWGIMALDPSLVLLFPLQLLHALTFGATHLGAMHFIHRTVPQEQAGTAQAIFATATGGVAMGLATLLAGKIYAPLGGTSYAAMAVLGLLGLFGAIALRRQRVDQ